MRFRQVLRTLEVNIDQPQSRQLWQESQHSPFVKITAGAGKETDLDLFNGGKLMVTSIAHISNQIFDLLEADEVALVRYVSSLVVDLATAL